MPAAREEKNAHYRVVEQRIMMARALEHFIGSKEFEDFVSDTVSDTYQKDPFYYAMGITSDDLLQEIKTGVTICIEQLKDQVKGYLV